ncbi:MAG: fatty acid desaturase [Candidatus Wallbacteria bacterium]|nr:fatty acid desaturase [Candidatus Wallbacteria bacterium]
MSPAPVLAGIGLFIGYLLLMPVLWAKSVALALVVVATIGGYLAVGLGYYRHELFHSYYRPLTKPLYHLTSWLVFSDPQVFRIAHPLHHGAVHTHEDIEFFCERYATDPARRRRQFILELLFGNAAWELLTLARLKRERKYYRPLGFLSFFCRAGLVALLCWVSSRLNPGSAGVYLLCYALTLWWGAVVSRHNQWLEHLGIVSDGSFDERNLLTRNLPDTGALNWLWNLYHRNDPREHVLHHTKAGLHSRVVPFELPEGTRFTSVAEYPAILRQYWRTLHS